MYIGRVGALAVALGIGLAVVSPPGFAVAAPEPDTNSGTTDGGAQDRNEPSTGNDLAGHRDQNTDPDANKGDGDGHVGDEDDRVGAGDPADEDAGGDADAGEKEGADDAEQDGGLDQGDVDAEQDGGLDQGDVDAEQDGGLNPADVDQVSDGNVGGPAGDRNASPLSNSELSEQTIHDPATSLRRNDEQSASNPLSISQEVTAPPPPAAFAPQSPTNLVATTAARHAAGPAPTAVVSQPIRLTAPLAVPAAVIGAVVRILDAVVASLTSPTPGAPVDTPLAWAVLAVVRRQFFNRTPTFTSTTSTPDAEGKVTITLSQTDSDGDVLRYTPTTGSKGTLTPNADGHSFTYTPAAGATGTDTVTFTATEVDSNHLHGFSGLLNAVSFGLVGGDGHTSAPTGVEVRLNTPTTVTVSSDIPDGDGAVVVRVKADDADGNPLTVTVTQPVRGRVSNPTLDASTGTYRVTYTPSDDARHDASADDATTADLSDSFTITVNDGHGSVVTRTVDVAVAPENDAPVFTTVTGTPDAAGKITGTIIFADSDDDTLTYSAPQNTGKGTVVVQSNGTYTYTPNTDARFVAAATASEDTDSFVVTVNDGHGVSVTRTINVTITPADLASNPTAAFNAAQSVLNAAVQQRATARAELASNLAMLPAADQDKAMAIVGAAPPASDGTLPASARDSLNALLAANGKSPLTYEETTMIIHALQEQTAAEADIDRATKISLDYRLRINLERTGSDVPVLSRIDNYHFDPGSGVATGTLVFINRDYDPFFIHNAYFTGGQGIGPFDRITAGSTAGGLTDTDFRYEPAQFATEFHDEISFAVYVSDLGDHLLSITTVTIPLGNVGQPTRQEALNELIEADVAVRAAEEARTDAIRVNSPTHGVDTAYLPVVRDAENDLAAAIMRRDSAREAFQQFI